MFNTSGYKMYHHFDSHSYQLIDVFVWSNSSNNVKFSSKQTLWGVERLWAASEWCGQWQMECRMWPPPPAFRLPTAGSRSTQLSPLRSPRNTRQNEQPSFLMVTTLLNLWTPAMEPARRCCRKRSAKFKCQCRGVCEMIFLSAKLSCPLKLRLNAV